MVDNLKSRLRWSTKKAARGAVSQCSSALASFRNQDHSVRVITYHRFGDAIRDPFCVSADDFEQQVEYLAENDMAMSLDEFLSYVATPYALPSNKIVVTIDDGFASTSSIAQPILERYGIPSVAFVSPALIDGTAALEFQPEAYMTWEQVEASNDSLMKIGSHSLAHESYGRLSLDAAREDATQSKLKLEQHTNYPVESFAYPFGTRSDYNDEVAALLEESGYKVAFTSLHGSVQKTDSLLKLPRVKVESGESIRAYERLTKGAMDAWAFVDTYLSSLQANR